MASMADSLMDVSSALPPVDAVAVPEHVERMDARQLRTSGNSCKSNLGRYHAKFGDILKAMKCDHTCTYWPGMHKVNSYATKKKHTVMSRALAGAYMPISR